MLTAHEQLKVLTRVWGNDREGYVFLPWISGTARTTEARRKAYHEGPAYEWPKDKSSILEYLGTHTDDDVYFTPCLFDMDRRIEQAAVAERALWADLDPVDPDTLGEWRPTIAWETSPGRYQGIWLLDHAKVGLSWQGKENHKLTNLIGADPSGWDTTQLLRVPGRANIKPDYGKVEGRLLWSNGPRYQLSDLDSLPDVKFAVGEDVDLLDEDLIAGIDRQAVWARVRLKVSAKVREYMGVRGKPGDIGKGEGADRSEVAWQIARDLAEAGCSIAEIVAVIRPTVWNKHYGRNDELRRLKIEAAKAIAAKGEDQSLESAVADVERPPTVTMTSLMGGARTRPRWLIAGIWSEGGVGFISGAPKLFKSWFGLDMAISVATGLPFLGDVQHATKKSPVLYVQEEDSEMAVVNRAEAIVMGRAPHLHPWGNMRISRGRVIWSPPVGDMDNLYVYARRGFKVSDPAWQGWLDEELDRLKAGLLVIDTLGTTAGEVDLDRASDLQHKILRPLRTLAAKHRTAVAVVHHNRKANGDNVRAGQQLLGSVALHAWVEDALYIREKESIPGGYRVLVERESKAAPDRRFAVHVPMMGISYEHDGVADGKAEAGYRDETMTWWTPSVQLITSDAGVDTVAPTPVESHARRGNGYTPGEKVFRMVKNMAGPSKNPTGVTLEHLVNISGHRPAELTRQLNNAKNSGLLVEQDGRWFPA